MYGLLGKGNLCPDSKEPSLLIVNVTDLIVWTSLKEIFLNNRIGRRGNIEKQDKIAWLMPLDLSMANKDYRTQSKGYYRSIEYLASNF